MGLPRLFDLTSEQAEITLVPLEGRWLVTGPPGSGKTIMALYRLWTLTTAQRPVSMLTHGNLLNQYCRLGAKELGVEAHITTFHRWFNNFWKQHVGGEPPTLGPDRWDYDWLTILGRLNQMPAVDKEFEYLVIDEGQDLPPYFYLLCQVIASHVTVFADEDQRITERQSTLSEIESGLGPGTRRHTVSANRRNTREIAAFGRHFYCGSPASLPPMPERRGALPVVNRIPSLGEFAAQLGAYAAVNTHEEIGVIFKHTDLQRWFHTRLVERKIAGVQAYISGDPGRRKVDFTMHGIRIVSTASMKGLEFDTVFAPDLDAYDEDPSGASVRMRFYVLATRARNSLHLAYKGDREPPIVASVPHNLLERKRWK